jgi:acetyl esterase/lipase
MSGALIELPDFAQDFRTKDVFPKMFGADKAYFEANEPLRLLRRNADSIRGRTQIRVAVGGKDRLQPRSQTLHELLEQLKIDHEYEVVPGVVHNQPQFYTTLGERAFMWYQRALKRD